MLCEAYAVSADALSSVLISLAMQNFFILGWMREHRLGIINDIINLSAPYCVDSMFWV